MDTTDACNYLSIYLTTYPSIFYYPSIIGRGQPLDVTADSSDNSTKVCMLIKR